MELSEILKNLNDGAKPMIYGPLKDGHYVQIGLGFGFYVPESDFAIAQERANRLGRLQFLSVTKEGVALHSDSRELLLENPLCCGMIAWVTPRTPLPGNLAEAGN